MSKGNIYIYYEIFKREFISNLLLSILAAKKNFNVYIGTGASFDNLLEAGLLNPGIFHTKSLTHGKYKHNFHLRLHKKKFIITSMDQEHGVIDGGNFDDLFIKPRISKEDLDLCEKYFCWGKYDQKKLVSKFKDKKKFVLTGSPRVDLWKKNFKYLWKDKKLKKKVFSFCF